MQEYCKLISEDGKEVTETYEKDYKLHREDGPAYILRRNGAVVKQVWYKEGKEHNDNGPSSISWDIDGNVKNERWCKDGEELFGETLKEHKKKCLGKRDVQIEESVQEYYPETPVQDITGVIKGFLGDDLFG